MKILGCLAVVLGAAVGTLVALMLGLYVAEWAARLGIIY